MKDWQYLCIIAVIIVVIITVFICLEVYKKKYKWSLFRADKMSGQDFEKYIFKVFSALGYKCTLTKSSGDQGIDLIIKKNFTTTGIQIKRYKNNVSNKAIQEAVAGKKYYKLKQVAVVSNSYFTASAIELAKVNDVELLNRQDLQDLFNELIKSKK